MLRHLGQSAFSWAWPCAWAALAIIAVVPAQPSSARAEAGLGTLRLQIEKFIRKHAEEPPDSIWIPPLDDFALPDVDPSTVRIDLSTRARKPLRGTVPVSVALANDRRVLKRGIVTARVHTTRNVVVATRSLRRGEMLTHADLRLSRLDTARLPREASSDIESLVGKQLNRNVRADALIRTSWATAPALVARGQRVRIVLEGSDLRIEGTGKAMSDGALGDLIRVLNSDSLREVIGRVGARGAVHVAY